MSSARDVLLMLINKMQQPSLPELMEFANEVSYFHVEYRDIVARIYQSLYYHLNSLFIDRKIIRLTADKGYKRRYCIYHKDRRLDQFVEPIPCIVSQTSNIVKIMIDSEEILLDTRNKDLKTKRLSNGRELQIFGFRGRFFVILDHVLLGILTRNHCRWYVRLPWRIFNLGSEYIVAVNKLRLLGERVDVLGVKGKRTICRG